MHASILIVYTVRHLSYINLTLPSQAPNVKTHFNIHFKNSTLSHHFLILIVNFNMDVAKFLWMGMAHRSCHVSNKSNVFIIYLFAQ